jgi:uncharacterized RDD family membrane protein YckC
MESRVGFGPRLGAWALDLVIFLIVGGLCAGSVARLFPEALARQVAEAASKAAQAPENVRSVMAGIQRFTLGLTMLGPIYGLIEAFTGTSPGKMILGLRIAQADAAPAPIGQLFGRYAIKGSGQLLGVAFVLTGMKALQGVSLVAAVGIFVGCFFTLGVARQAVHDMLLKTAVFRRSDLAARAAGDVPPPQMPR